MNPGDPHILVVDDDRRLQQLLQKYLMENGFLVSTAESAADAEAKLQSLTFDLMIVDVMMPGEDGMSFTQRIRDKAGIPIVMLTARGEGDDRIAGLESGADDYLPKPFEPRELVLRVRSVLRRNEPQRPPDAVARFGPFSFDVERMELLRDGTTVALTSREAALLKVFARNPGATLSRMRLSQQSGSGERTIDVQVTRLRRKIEDDPRMPRFLQTVWGEGYVLRTEHS
ncbi:MAG: response regulator [Alphaproteobacteria bacterium]|jgi:two-component system, OmpR family, phosphate regulon response regulator OmpR|nr:response regulator [Rhodospirillaceae bacterium]MBT6510413.1 response regulator [Rhodospirillaceae bacterium]MBT7615358.1 response regulator [Rhodospirillaceae bacterium]MBT7646906.1 response regulator [Rhodospirillaceae bacterium]MDG2481659.1 response regulator [Alphaproteobacteria bacterium]